MHKKVDIHGHGNDPLSSQAEMATRPRLSSAMVMGRTGNTRHTPVQPHDELDQDQLDRLCRRARRIRRPTWGNRITYSRKLFIPLTNMCRDECGYCAFVESPDSPNAHVMTPDEALSSLEAGEQAGCKEVLVSLGENPELRYEKARRALDRLGYDSMVDYLVAMCELVLQKTSMVPHVNAGTLSDEEMTRLRPVSASMGMMLESISKRL